MSVLSNLLTVNTRSRSDLLSETACLKISPKMVLASFIEFCISHHTSTAHALRNVPRWRDLAAYRFAAAPVVIKTSEAKAITGQEKNNKRIFSHLHDLVKWTVVTVQVPVRPDRLKVAKQTSFQKATE